jgi:serine/threonine protein kinase
MVLAVPTSPHVLANAVLSVVVLLLLLYVRRLVRQKRRLASRLIEFTAIEYENEIGTVLQSYLIDPTDIKLGQGDENFMGNGAEGFVRKGKFQGATVAGESYILGFVSYARLIELIFLVCSGFVLRDTVKVVTLGMTTAHREEIITLAEHEVKLLQQLHHPNIVTLYGMSVKNTSFDTKLMLVMECCSCSLKVRVQYIYISLPSPFRSRI